jgi:hypothetical protein
MRWRNRGLPLRLRDEAHRGRPWPLPVGPGTQRERRVLTRAGRPSRESTDGAAAVNLASHHAHGLSRAMAR